MSAPWQAVWLLAGEVAAVVVLTSLIAWRLRSVVWQRTLWQAGLIAVLGLLVVEFASIGKGRQEVRDDDMASRQVEVVPDAPVVETAIVPELSISEYTPGAELVLELPPASALLVPSTVGTEQLPALHTELASDGIAPEKPGFPLMLAVALGVWIVGSAVLAMRLFVGRILLLKFCARSQAVAEKGLFCRVQGIADKLGLKQAVRVLETERIQTPVVFGLFRPSIALPVGFAARFQPKQQEAILAHELAHLGARDPLWYLLADALASVLWWHPLVWVARARLHVASELAADEACVLAEQGPATLAECLVTIAQEMHGPGTLESIGIEGSGFRSRLGQRVERLLQLSAEMVSKPALWRTRLVKVGMPVLLLSLLVLGSGWMRKDASAPWSGVVEGAWQKATGALQTAEVDIRRDPRPVLLAATPALGNAADASAGNGEKEREAAALLQAAKKLYGLGRLEEALEKAKEAVKLSRSAESAAYLSYFNELRLLEPKLREREQAVLAGANGKEVQVFRVIPIYEDALVKGLEKLTGKKPELLNIDGQGPTNRTVAAWKQIVDATKEVISKRGVNVAKLDIGPEILNYSAEPKLILLNVRGFPKDLDATKDIVAEIHEAAEPGDRREAAAGNERKSDEAGSARLDTIRLAKTSLRDVTLGEAINRLNSSMQRGGRSMTLRADGKVATSFGNLEVGLVVCNTEVAEGATLREALDAVCKGAVYGLQWVEKGDVIVFQPKAEVKPVETAVEKVKREKEDVSALVQSGKALYEQKRLNEAEGKLREAMRLDPTNAAAYYYMNLVQKERYGDLAVKRDEEQRTRISEVQKVWEIADTTNGLPVRNHYIRIGKVDTNLFFKELESKTSEKLDLKVEGDEGHYSYSSINLNRLLQQYFAAAGLNCEINQADAQGASVSFNPALAIMWVRGNPDEVGAAQKLLKPFLRETFLREPLPTPNPYVRTNGPQATTKSRQRILAKLDQMVIKELYFDGKPLAEVVQFLQEESVKLDPEKLGLNFIINSNLDDQPSSRSAIRTVPLGAPKLNAGAVDLEKTIIKISPPLKNLRMIDALDAVCKVASGAGEYGLAFMVEDYAVVFRQRVIEPPQMFTRIFKIEADSFTKGLEKRMGVAVDKVELTPDEIPKTSGTNQTATGNSNIWTAKLQKLARVFFEKEGVNLKGVTNGPTTQIFFNDRTGSLMVRASLADLEIIQSGIEAVLSSQAKVEEPARMITKMFSFDPDALVKGLEKLTGKSVETLTEAALAGKVPANEAEGITNRVTTRVAQIFSLAEQYFAGQGADMSKVTISPLFKIIPYELKGMMPVRASEADMDIIQKSLDKIMAAGKLQPQSRVFQLQNESVTNIVRAIRGSFTSPPSTAIADVPGNKLIVRATEEDMKRVEEFIQKLDAPGSGEVREERITKVFKVDPDSAWNGFREMMAKSGFASTNLQEMMREFMLRSGVRLSESNTNGTVILLNERTGVLLARATPKEMEIIQSAIEVMNIVPPQISIEAQYVEVPEKVAEEMGLKWFANGLPPDKSKLSSMIRVESLSKTNESGMHIDAPQVPNHVSILSPAQARELQSRLAKAPGINRLSAPRVTTMNKRQAQIAVVDTATIVVGRTNRLVKGEAGQKDTEEPVFITDQLAMGPVLDVIPSVYPDGKSMQLDWVFSLTEFLGYDKPEKKDELPEPQVRTRYVSNQNVIQDGYTLVAGCGMADVEVKTDGKKGWFRSKHPKTEKKMVLILMTATLIDAAGNAVNSDR